MSNTHICLTGMAKCVIIMCIGGDNVELRVLQYFLAVTREQSISGAAESLHLSQPTLSRQLKDMEDELGKQLLIRGNRKVTLTEEGMILRKRAEEILELVKKAEEEISQTDDIIAGDITIGAGETDGIRFLTRAAQKLQKEYPLVHFHIISGDGITVTENLDKGLIDFGLIFGEVDESKYEYINVPYQDTWGVLMRRDCPLAKKKSVSAKDLEGLPLIISRQALHKSELLGFFSGNINKINVAATYNLLFNGSLMVEEGMGYAICFDKIINVSGDSNLCFRPLKPEITASMHVVWKKYQVLTRAAELFLNKLKENAAKERDTVK